MPFNLKKIEPDNFYSLPEITELTGIPYITLRSWTVTGKITFSQPSKDIFIKGEWLAAALNPDNKTKRINKKPKPIKNKKSKNIEIDIG